MDRIEIAVAVRNMRLYDSAEGKYCAIPFTFSIDSLDCIYIPASAGPTAAPIILISILVPSDIPMNWLGVDSMVTFIAPTFVNDKPVERIARSVDINKGAEWKTKRPKNPAEVMDVPAMTGFIDPSFEIIKPDVGPNIKSIIANGNCMLPVVIASSPNPSGGGFLTRIGIV